MTFQNCESEYEFALVLSGVDLDRIEDVAEALYGAGCDDATLSVRSGRVYLTFARRAASMKLAILSAIKDVIKARVGASVLLVDECNLVTQADMARRMGRSRQVVHQFINGLRGPGGFPAPVCGLADESPLWRWCEVAHWLWENDMIAEDVFEQAEAVDAINTVLEMLHKKKRRPALVEEVLNALDG